MSILEAKEIVYTYHTKYQRIPALCGVSCSFDPGKLYAIIGSSGGGKTTLLSLLAGLDLPESGQVLYCGVSTAALNRNEYRRKNVSVVYQSFNLFPLLNALENVMVPMGLNRVSEKEAKIRARQLLQSVGLPQTTERQFPKMMSGGEQQRVAIARALASEAPLILADEPTGNLDTENSNHIVDILQSLAHEQNRCVIVITHDPGVAERADTVLRLVDGRLV